MSDVTGGTVAAWTACGVGVVALFALFCHWKGKALWYRELWQGALAGEQALRREVQDLKGELLQYRDAVREAREWLTDLPGQGEGTP